MQTYLMPERKSSASVSSSCPGRFLQNEDGDAEQTGRTPMRQPQRTSGPTVGNKSGFMIWSAACWSLPT